MRLKRCAEKMVAAFWLGVALLCFTAGRSTLQTDGEGSLFPATDKKEEEPTSQYYDFSDVLIPSDLKLDRKASSVISTPGFSAGVIVMNGRVEVDSLINFFQTNMAKDNWRTVCSFKSGKSLMLFHKENRWCVISIMENNFTTNTEIWVAPTAGDFRAATSR